VLALELDGERHDVTLRREGDQWIAGVGGRDVSVSVAEAAGRWSLLVSPAETGPHAEPGVSRISYDVSFEATAAGGLIVHVSGVAVPVAFVNGRRPGRRGSRDSSTDRGSRAIVAPMPGRIVRVLVKPGETVSPRQPLVVVEAMKMENELRAPRGGTVTEVRVTEGASVEANAVLVVIE
jgi:biotin carboxyl carrier protein